MDVGIQPYSRPQTFDRTGVAVVLRRYGFFGLDVDNNGQPIDERLWFGTPSDAHGAEVDRAHVRVFFLQSCDDGETLGLRCESEDGGQLLYSRNRPNLFAVRKPEYYALLQHFTVEGKGIQPILETTNRKPVVAWWNHKNRCDLIIGLNLTEEAVLHTQGDSLQPDRCSAEDKAVWGFGHERPVYLYRELIHDDFSTIPWMDYLGYRLAECFAIATKLPLVEMLPGAARGAVMLTGDDDQAYLEKYDEQLELVGDFPLSYLLLPCTRHTRSTLRRLPPNVELGLHVDALEHPEQYESICIQQSAEVRELTGTDIGTVRNHGHLSRGYWDHLSAWENTNLTLDLNLPGMEHTAYTASFMPFRVRRPDETWSHHFSLFSGFSDSMHYALAWPVKRQRKRFQRIVRQIERNRPGVLVVNLHPQNVSDTQHIHLDVLRTGRRRNWVALGIQSYLRWIGQIESLRLCGWGETATFHATSNMKNMWMRRFLGNKWACEPISNRLTAYPSATSEAA